MKVLLLTLSLIQLQVYPYFTKVFSTFQSRTEFQGATVAATIRNAKTNEIVWHFNGEKRVNPASTLKLVTTGTAMATLGKTFQFQTTIGYTGNIQNGKINGNLTLQGNGDPGLANSRFGTSTTLLARTIADRLKKAGVQEISGDILLVNSGIEQFDVNDFWPWNDVGNYYGATAYKLNVAENFYTIYLNGGRQIGESATVDGLFPFTNSLQFINQVTTAAAGTGDNVYIYAAPFSNTVVLKGTIPLGAKRFGVKGSMPNPPLFLGELLKNELTNNGIIINGTPKLQSYEPYGIQTLYQIDSPTLPELIKQCNFESINLIADALAKKMGENRAGAFSYDAGTKAIVSHWQQYGIAEGDLQLKDGSGLSPLNLVTTNALSGILGYLSTQDFFPVYLETIPKLGVNGTVARLGRGSKAANKVWVKSGSIESTRAFAGYFYGKSGELYTFSVCVNRYPADKNGEVRSFLEDFLIHLVEN